MGLDGQIMNKQDPWSGVLASAAWAIRSTIHSVFDATPGQIIFGRDMIYDLSFRVKWNEIRAKRIKRAKSNRDKENSTRIIHKYRVGDKVLLSRGVLQRKLLPLRDGPYTVTKVNNNGTLTKNKGVIEQTVSIRRLTPYFS